MIFEEASEFLFSTEEIGPSRLRLGQASDQAPRLTKSDIVETKSDTIE